VTDYRVGGRGGGEDGRRENYLSLYYTFLPPSRLLEVSRGQVFSDGPSQSCVGSVLGCM